MSSNTSANLVHLPQGQPQRDERTLSMVVAMRNELFGSCTNQGECEAVFPKQIPMEFIGRMNRDLMRSVWHRQRVPLVIPNVVQLPTPEDSYEQFHEGVGAQLQKDVHQQSQEEAQAHVPAESPEPAAVRQ